jgi:hypothetical protein
VTSWRHVGLQGQTGKRLICSSVAYDRPGIGLLAAPIVQGISRKACCNASMKLGIILSSLRAAIISATIIMERIRVRRATHLFATPPAWKTR